MKKYILIILCCLKSFPLWSYNVNMIVEHYSVDQGLPNNTVNCTLKDRDGFIWFGTWYGLCCFDGVKFKTFNKQEHASYYVNLNYVKAYSPSHVKCGIGNHEYEIHMSRRKYTEFNKYFIDWMGEQK